MSTDTSTGAVPGTTNAGTPVVRHEVFQTSLMSALLDGIYDGEMTIGELLGHGNFGLGTFDGLDGEMVILDSVCYQLRGDGGASLARQDQRTPFAVVTNFVPNIRQELPENLARKQVSAIVDHLTMSPNYLYALRIVGDFEWVRTRTVVLQQKPYPPMTKATEGEPVIEHRDVRGIVAGFRTPIYEQGISVPGCHAHFIDDARTRGGHVMDFQLRSGYVELCLGTDLRMSLPLTEAFRSANLSPEDLADQISKTEAHD